MKTKADIIEARHLAYELIDITNYKELEQILKESNVSYWHVNELVYAIDAFKDTVLADTGDITYATKMTKSYDITLQLLYRYRNENF